MGSEERQELEAKIEELEDKVWTNIGAWTNKAHNEGLEPQWCNPSKHSFLDELYTPLWFQALHTLCR